VKISPAAPAVQAPPAPPARARPARRSPTSTPAPKGSDYPLAAARANATGTTRVRFTVDGSGKLSKVEVVKSSGPPANTACSIAWRWTSSASARSPALTTGHPVGGTFEFEYVWTLQ
jgi:protein TonB